MIQLTHRGPVFERDAAWKAASRAFAERHCVLLPQFVEGSLLQRILRWLAQGEFKEREDKQRDGTVFAREVALAPHTPIPSLFRLLLNNPVLFPSIQELVDCRADSFPPRKDAGDGRVSSFVIGRCFKMMPGDHHFDSWHGDVNDGRQIGLSVNLEPDPTAAGGLEIRRRQWAGTTRVVPEFGDAVLFRIAQGLEHRGLPPAGAVPKCTFSGWFSTGRHYREVLGFERQEATAPATGESTEPDSGAADPPDSQ